MGREESEPIEPTPESNPYGYFLNLLGGKKAREIRTMECIVGIMLPEDSAEIPHVTVHVFKEPFTKPKDFFVIDSNSGLMAARLANPSATGLLVN